MPRILVLCVPSCGNPLNFVCRVASTLHEKQRRLCLIAVQARKWGIVLLGLELVHILWLLKWCAIRNETHNFEDLVSQPEAQYYPHAIAIICKWGNARRTLNCAPRFCITIPAPYKINTQTIVISDSGRIGCHLSACNWDDAFSCDVKTVLTISPHLQWFTEQYLCKHIHIQ